MSEIIITREFLEKHKKCCFVFGDNVFRVGHGGAASLRDVDNTYGFITKIRPDNDDSSFFKPIEYKSVLTHEIMLLNDFLLSDVYDYLLVSKIGSGLANKYGIWNVIKPALESFRDSFFGEIILLWEYDNIQEIEELIKNDD